MRQDDDPKDKIYDMKDIPDEHREEAVNLTGILNRAPQG